MHPFFGVVGSIGSDNLVTNVALGLGVVAVLASIAQLALLRRVNLIPVVVGAIAATFFTSALGWLIGLIHAVMALGSTTSPDERKVLFGVDLDALLFPMFITVFLLLLATILGTIAAAIRANRKPAPQ